MKIRRILSTFKQLKRATELLRCFRDFSSPFRIALAFTTFYPLRYPHRLIYRERYHLDILCWEDLTTAWVVLLGKEYRIMPDDLRVLDIGANIGVFSIFAREQLAEITILAIEPSPPTYELLNRNLASNNLGQAVRTRNIAISGQSGEVSFQSSPAIPSHSRKISEFPAEESVAIQCLTLADLFESENLDEIDFIKIDIEGAEYDVLLSSSFETLRKGRRYGIEYHGRGPDELTSHFGHAGFLVTDHPKKGQSGIIEFTRLEQFPRV